MMKYCRNCGNEIHYRGYPLTCDPHICTTTGIDCLDRNPTLRILIDAYNARVDRNKVTGLLLQDMRTTELDQYP